MQTEFHFRFFFFFFLASSSKSRIFFSFFFHAGDITHTWEMRKNRQRNENWAGRDGHVIRIFQVGTRGKSGRYSTLKALWRKEGTDMRHYGGRGARRIYS